FYPSDKRELYKANLFKHRQKIEKVEDIAEKMNEERESKDKITSSRLYSILKGASHVSLDYTPTNNNNEELELITVHSRIPNDGPSQEEEYLQIDLLKKIKNIFKKYLSIRQNKIFKLKGETYD
ncbi:MAG: hypothetical protein ACTSVM_01610, partial [Candidatus Ranarchaeia archaeon]